MPGVGYQRQVTLRRLTCNSPVHSESTIVLFLPADAGAEAVK